MSNILNDENKSPDIKNDIEPDHNTLDQIITINFNSKNSQFINNKFVYNLTESIDLNFFFSNSQ